MNTTQTTLDVEELKDLLQNTGDDIANVLEQLTRGNWVDSEGHPVKNNVAMIQLITTLTRIGEYRAANLGYTPFT